MKYEAFMTENGLDPAKFDKPWAFCLGNPWENPADADSLGVPEWLAFADELAQLVVKGIKTATASEFASYARDNYPLPEVNGKFDIVLDSHGQPVCAIETTKVYVVKFSDVTAEHAYKEGDGLPTQCVGKSVDEVSAADLAEAFAYWRRVHEEFFTIDGNFDTDMDILCEEFQLVSADRK